MSVLDIAMNLAAKNPDKLANFLGKSPRDVQNAISQAQKLLPEITRNPTAEGGAALLDRLGVDKGFLGDVFDRYGGFGSKVGLGKGAIKNAINGLTKAMDKGRPAPASSANRKTAGFDVKRYPRV